MFSNPKSRLPSTTFRSNRNTSGDQLVLSCQASGSGKNFFGERGKDRHGGGVKGKIKKETKPMSKEDVKISEKMLLLLLTRTYDFFQKSVKV